LRKRPELTGGGLFAAWEVGGCKVMA